MLPAKAALRHYVESVAHNIGQHTLDRLLRLVDRLPSYDCDAIMALVLAAELTTSESRA